MLAQRPAPKTPMSQTCGAWTWSVSEVRCCPSTALPVAQPVRCGESNRCSMTAARHSVTPSRDWQCMVLEESMAADDP